LKRVCRHSKGRGREGFPCCSGDSNFELEYQCWRGSPAQGAVRGHRQDVQLVAIFLALFIGRAELGRQLHSDLVVVELPAPNLDLAFVKTGVLS